MVKKYLFTLEKILAKITQPLFSVKVRRIANKIQKDFNQCRKKLQLFVISYVKKIISLFVWAFSFKNTTQSKNLPKMLILH